MIGYITFREPDKDGVLQYYILQKAFPHYVGRVVTYPVEGALANAPVAGYHFYVTFAGTIRGNMIPSFNDVATEIESVYFEMAQWYYTNRIRGNEEKYKKWKIVNP